MLGLELSRTSAGWLLARARAPAAQRVQELFAPRFTERDIEESASILLHKSEGAAIVLLTDQCMSDAGRRFPVVACGSDPVSRIREFDFKTTSFLYACDSDDLGLPYIREIVAGGGKFFPVQVYTPSRYSNINGAARRILESEHARQLEEGFAKFDFGPGDFLNIVQAIDITSHLSGDYVEIGCFRGSSSCVALAYMKEVGIRRNCYFLDVFEGFDYEAARNSADTMWLDSHATEGIEIISKRIATRSSPESGLHAAVIKSNVVESPLPGEIAGVVVANIDVDLYEAVLAGLAKIAPKMVPGGVIIVEDPGHTPALIGSRLALAQFLETEIATAFIPVYLESGQTYLIKTASS